MCADHRFYFNFSTALFLINFMQTDVTHLTFEKIMCVKECGLFKVKFQGFYLLPI